ncbi:MAG: hypothetical protein DRI61_08270 [Chloroflexi bacterium]|nr:MAG: hypothetical protein DRI61_08270 [Chloroflexota bacterium]
MEKEVMEGMGEEEKKGEITIEELYEGLKVAAIINCFEKEFGKMPHPLRFFKFRRRVDYFEVFLKGVAVGEKLAELVQKVEKKKTIEVVGEDE